MPFNSTAEVRANVPGAEELSEAELQTFMDTFNGCVADHDGQETGPNFDCFAIAMSQAQSAGGDGTGPAQATGLESEVA